MVRFTLLGVWSRKRRLLATSSSIVLGVAFLVATLVLGDTLRGGFGDLVARNTEGTDVVVRNETVVGAGDVILRGLISDSLVDEVALIAGVDRAVNLIEGVAQVIGSDGRPVGGQGPPTRAFNWIDDVDLNSFRIAQGRSPATVDEVVLDIATAESAKVSTNDLVTIRTPRAHTFKVVGLASFGDLDSYGSTTYVAFTTDAAQRYLLGSNDEATAVVVSAVAGVDAARLRGDIAAVLPPGIEALTSAELEIERRAELDGLVGFVEAFLLVFAAIALLVATFSIHNTFSILVAQRTKESALLRAIGASRRQIFGAIGAEALVVGCAASGVGLGAGVGLAKALLKVLESMGFETSTTGLDLQSRSFVVAVAVGVIVTVVASLRPAVKASRVAPLEALREAAVERASFSVARFVVGFGLFAAGVGLTVRSVRFDEPLVIAGLGAVVLLVGVVALGPLAARPSAAVIGAPLPLFRGMTGLIARRNAMRNPRRTAGSASALMIGTAVVVLFATFGHSMKASIDDTVDKTFAGDLVVVRDSFSGATIDPEFSAAIDALPEVAGTAAVADIVMRVDGVDEFPSAIEPARFTSIFDMNVLSGNLADMRAGEIAVSSHWADAGGVGLDDRITALFSDGEVVEFSVVAVYQVRDILGDLLITRDDFEPHAGVLGDTVVMIELAAGTSLTAGRAAIDAVGAEFSAPVAQTRKEYVNSVAGEIDQLLTMVYGMLALAILIAVMGIANTLALSIHERTRELGLLRAVGQTRAQVRSSVRWESVIIAVFGTIGGVSVGTFLSWGLLSALREQEGFGIFSAPVLQLAIIVVLAGAAGVVAALRPANRAAKRDLLSSIAAA